MLKGIQKYKASILILISVLGYLAIRLAFSAQDTANTISIGSKNFTESMILGELYAQVLEQGGFQINRKFNLGGTLIAHEALKQGDIDLYPEYTGTGLIDILKISPNPDEALAFQALSAGYLHQWNLHWLKPAQANNSQGLVMTRKLADHYHIRTLTDLSRQAHQLRLGSIPEFEEREDGLKGLQAFYKGFHFKEITLFSNGLKYKVLKQGNADVTVAFTTDGALLDSSLQLLEDDQHFWPAYRIAPVIRNAIHQKYPQIANRLNRLSAGLTTQSLQRLNHQVEQQKQDYRQVVKRYLAEQS